MDEKELRRFTLEPFSLKVTFVKDSADVWGVPVQAAMHIRYDEKTLLWCSQRNRKGEDWRLLWLNGFSLRQQFNRTTRWNGQAIIKFAPVCEQWFGPEAAPWATAKFEAGYYLFNFAGHFAGVSLRDQSERINGFGEPVLRATKAMVAEALLLVTHALKDRDAPLVRFLHVGEAQSSDGRVVCIGNRDCIEEKKREVLLAHVPKTSSGHSDLRVCLVRKFDH